MSQRAAASLSEKRRTPCGLFVTTVRPVQEFSQNGSNEKKIFILLPTLKNPEFTYILLSLAPKEHNPSIQKIHY